MGCTLSVVTGKPHIFAQRILDHFELTRMFRGVHGSALADRQFTKTRLIHDACAAVPELAGATLMIGDRADDVQSAKEARVHSLAVTWGYAGENELTTAQRDYMVDSPAQLVDCVRSLMGEG